MTKPNLTNLLDETLAVLEKHSHRPYDVLWVGTRDWSCSFTDFAQRAKSINYNSGFGLAAIRRDLVIVGDGWWLERYEYDGSEWWAYKTPPIQKPEGNCGILRDNTADIVSRMEALDVKRNALLREMKDVLVLDQSRGTIDRFAHALAQIEVERIGLDKQMEEIQS